VYKNYILSSRRDVLMSAGFKGAGCDLYIIGRKNWDAIFANCEQRLSRCRTRLSKAENDRCRFFAVKRTTRD
jgi:hypothetical protein